jgi:hypothetical protein
VFGACTSVAKLASLAQPRLARAGAGGARPVVQRAPRRIRKPLESKGRFCSARSLGIEWHTQRPFDSQFVLTAPASRSATGR